ncbi:MAG: hypothetical protein RL548_150 [Bacteroidota bacterium]
MDVPKDVYPVGRLDYDSEGLLFLTNDTKMNHQLLHPSFEHKRTYWVQVEGNITIEAIEQLAKGVSINVNGIKYQSQPAVLSLLEANVAVPERNPPIRFSLFDLEKTYLALGPKLNLQKARIDRYAKCLLQ